MRHETRQRISESRRRRTEEDRFLAKVEPLPETGCWLWAGNIGRDGYGRFDLGSRVDAYMSARKAIRQMGWKPTALWEGVGRTVVEMRRAGFGQPV